MKRIGDPLEDGAGKLKKVKLEDYDQFLLDIASTSLEELRGMNRQLFDEKGTRNKEVLQLNGSWQKADASRNTLTESCDKLGDSLYSLFFCLQVFYQELPCPLSGDDQRLVEEHIGALAQFPYGDNAFQLCHFDDDSCTSLFDHFLLLFRKCNEVFAKYRGSWETAKQRNQTNQAWTEYYEKDTTSLLAQKNVLAWSLEHKLEPVKRSTGESLEQQQKQQREMKKTGKKALKEEVFTLSEVLDRAERHTHRLQLAYRQRTALEEAERIEEEKLDLGLSALQGTPVKQEGEDQKPGLVKAESSNVSTNNTNTNTNTNNNNNFQAPSLVKSEPSQVEPAIPVDPLERVMSEVTAKQARIEQMREHVLTLSRQVRDRSNGEAGDLATMERDVKQSGLFRQLSGEMGLAEQRCGNVIHNYDANIKRLLDLREKRVAEKAVKKKRLKDKRIDQEAKILENEVRLKHLQSTRDKVAYETELLKANVPRPEIVAFLSRQNALLQRLVEAQKTENDGTESDIADLRKLIEERETANDPVSLQQAYQKILSEGTVLQLQLDETLERWGQARDRDYEYVDSKNTQMFKFLRSERLLDDQIANEQGPMRTEEQREADNKALERQIGEWKTKLRQLEREECQRAFPEIQEDSNASTDQLWNRMQQDAYQRRLRKAREDFERKSQQMVLIEPDYLSIQGDSELLAKQMTACEDKSLRLATENVQLTQACAGTQKKIEGVLERSKKLEQRASEVDDTNRKIMKTIAVLEDRVERVDREIKSKQLRALEVYPLIRDLTFAVSDALERVNKLQVEAEKAKKCGKVDASHEKQLKEERSLVAQLTQEQTALKKKLDGYNKNLRGSLSRSASSLDMQNVKREELEKYKNLARCSVCHDRLKDCVLTTCYHVFCRQCLESNLQSRHRKCPGCNIQFDRSNMRDIEL